MQLFIQVSLCTLSADHAHTSKSMKMFASIISSLHKSHLSTIIYINILLSWRIFTFYISGLIFVDLCVNEHVLSSSMSHVERKFVSLDSGHNVHATLQTPSCMPVQL
jgi:hypothetical protein